VVYFSKLIKKIKNYRKLLLMLDLKIQLSCSL